MKTYKKEKLHECARELFALCLEKGIQFEIDNECESILIDWGRLQTNISEDTFKEKDHIIDLMPIWELIEKVKAL